METGHQRSMLAEIPRQVYTAYIVMLLAKPSDYLKGIIRRTIVDKNKLPAVFVLQIVHLPADIRHNTLQHFGRTIAGNYYAYQFTHEIFPSARHTADFFVFVCNSLAVRTVTLICFRDTDGPSVSNHDNRPRFLSHP